MTAWVEKYRPTRIDDIVLPNKLRGNINNIIKRIKENENTKSGETITHLILYSNSAGTGKTTTAIAIANELGYDSIIVNGSNEGRLIETLRGTITSFATGIKIDNITKKRCIIIDEADMLPKDTVQNALRTTMERFAIEYDVLFILTCNNISDIKTPLLSRTAQIPYGFTNEDVTEIKEQALNYIEYILDNENVKTDKVMNFVHDNIDNYLPDVRSFINHLQFYIDEISDYEVTETERTSGLQQLDNDILSGNLAKATQTLKNKLRNLPLSNFCQYMLESVINDRYPIHGSIKFDVINVIVNLTLKEYECSNVDVIKMGIINIIIKGIVTNANN